jgi:hypothetical protein
VETYSSVPSKTGSILLIQKTLKMKRRNGRPKFDLSNKEVSEYGTSETPIHSDALEVHCQIPLHPANFSRQLS